MRWLGLGLGLLVGSLPVALSGCASEGSRDAAGAPGPVGNVGVGQGGAQDFGKFREILEAGEIPGPETIDDLGFFNEHRIALPDPQCGQDVCMHGMLGVMGNFVTGSNCTMVFIGMNTPLDPDDLHRPPLNLAIALDLSGSMRGQNIRFATAGLHRMLTTLQPQDRVSLVGFSDEARVLVSDAAPDDELLQQTIDNLVPQGATNLYAGLRRAYEQVEEGFDPERQNRVILVSDGQATAGLSSTPRIVNLARSYGQLGISVSTVGLGVEFDVNLMRDVAEAGAGAFYFVEEVSAVQEVFVEEVEAFLWPLAQDARIELEVGSGYLLREIYGTRQAVVGAGKGTIEIPTLQIAHRTSASDNEEGRRGGGGAIIAELLPTDQDPGRVGELTFRYTEPRTGAQVQQQIQITSPLEAGETPEDGYFTDNTVEKGFVMLNVYVALRAASEHARAGEDGTALATLEAVEAGAREWLEDQPDEDIEDDLRYVRMFIENLQARSTPARPAVLPEPWPRD